MKYFVLTISLVFFLSSCKDDVDYSLLTNVNTEASNDFYINNKAPLQANTLIKLPVGSIAPHRWLEEILIRQRNGLTGHLGEISAWLQKEDNAWLSEDGTGAWGWEEVPYWLKGYANMEYNLILKERTSPECLYSFSK